MRNLPALVVVGLFVVVLAAGIVLWSAGWTEEARLNRDIRSCVADVAGRDPVADARADIARGQDQFYAAMPAGDAAPVRIAEGIVPRCELDGMFANHRPYPFAAGPMSGGGELVCDADDPAADECCAARAGYIQVYNREMARGNPRSIVKYCRQEAQP